MHPTVNDNYRVPVYQILNWQHYKSGTLFGAGAERGLQERNLLVWLNWDERFGRRRACVKCKATWLHPKQQECKWVTNSSHTFKWPEGIFLKTKKTQKIRKKRRMRWSSICHKMAPMWSQNSSEKTSCGADLKCFASTVFLLGWIGKCGPPICLAVLWLDEVFGQRGRRAGWSYVTPAVIRRP